MANAMARLLTERRKQIHEQMKALLDTAEAEKRSLSAEEQASFDKMNGDMDGLRKQVEQIVKFEQDDAEAARALDGLGIRGGDTGQDETRKFNENIRKIHSGELRSVELPSLRALDEVRALSKGTATAGGNTVPTDFVSRLYEHLIETATLLRGGATTLNTNSGETIEMPVTTSHGTAALVAESGTIPQNDPAFGKRSLGAYKYGVLILVPNELLTDTAVDLTGYLARQAGRAVGNALGAHLVTGTGTAQPAGIMNSTTLGVTGGTGVGGAPTFDNLIDLMYSVIGPYRNSPDAGWLIKDSTAGTLRKLKDSSGRYLWEPSVAVGIPDRVLGYPIYTDPNIAAVGLNNKSVAFGDLSTYYVRLVNGVRFERSDDFKFDTDQVAYRCLVRGDGMLLDQSGAIKHFAGGAS